MESVPSPEALAWRCAYLTIVGGQHGLLSKEEFSKQRSEGKYYGRRKSFCHWVTPKELKEW